MKTGRVLIVGTLIVALLAGAFAVVDVVARRVGEQELSRKAQAALSLDEPPLVTVSGWPFVVHALTRSFPTATLEVSAMSLRYSDNKTMKVSHVSVIANDIAPRGNGYVIGEANGTGVVDYAELSVVAEHATTYAGGGRIAIEVPVPVINATATVTGRLALDADHKSIALVDANIEFVGISVPTSISQKVLDGVTDPVPIAHDQFTAESVSADEDGVHFAVSAKQLTLGD